jgi:hypothetical protein
MRQSPVRGGASDEPGSAVPHGLCRGDPKKSRFARSVAPDHSDTVAGRNRQVGAVKNRLPAEGERDVSQL